MPLDAIGHPAVKDWCLTRLASFARTLTLSQDGVPIDLTGYTAEAAIVDERGEVLAGFVAAIPAPATDGRVTLTLTVAAITALPTRARWFLKLILTADPPNNTFIVLKGAVTVNEPSAVQDCC